MVIIDKLKEQVQEEKLLDALETIIELFEYLIEWNMNIEETISKED